MLESNERPELGESIIGESHSKLVRVRAVLPIDPKGTTGRVVDDFSETKVPTESSSHRSVVFWYLCLFEDFVQVREDGIGFDPIGDGRRSIDTVIDGFDLVSVGIFDQNDIVIGVVAECGLSKVCGSLVHQFGDRRSWREALLNVNFFKTISSVIDEVGLESSSVDDSVYLAVALITKGSGISLGIYNA